MNITYAVWTAADKSNGPGKEYTMKKINANEKDRVICVSSSNGKQDFYFQQGKGERVWLFQSN